MSRDQTLFLGLMHPSRTWEGASTLLRVHAREDSETIKAERFTDRTRHRYRERKKLEAEVVKYLKREYLNKKRMSYEYRFRIQHQGDSTPPPLTISGSRLIYLFLTLFIS